MRRLVTIALASALLTCGCGDDGPASPEPVDEDVAQAAAVREKLEQTYLASQEIWRQRQQFTQKPGPAGWNEFAADLVATNPELNEIRVVPSAIEIEDVDVIYMIGSQTNQSKAAFAIYTADGAQLFQLKVQENQPAIYKPY